MSEAQSSMLAHDPTRGLPTLVDVAAEAEGVLDRRRDIEMMVQSLLKGDLFSRMQASSNCRREMYVGAQFGEVTLWGYVDAVFVNPDGTLTLVDFKTDTLITSLVELARRYQPQMSGYVAALQQATGMQVSEAWLSVAQPDGAAAVEIAVDVLETSALLAELREVEAEFIGNACNPLQSRSLPELWVRHAPKPHLSAASMLARQIVSMRSQRP